MLTQSADQIWGYFMVVRYCIDMRRLANEKKKQDTKEIRADENPITRVKPMISFLVSNISLCNTDGKRSNFMLVASD